LKTEIIKLFITLVGIFIFFAHQTDKVMKTNRKLLKVEKANWRQALKNKSLYEQRRNELLIRIIEAEVPLWGGIKVIISKL
jgi:hypothetical protein